MERRIRLALSLAGLIAWALPCGAVPGAASLASGAGISPAQCAAIRKAALDFKGKFVEGAKPVGEGEVKEGECGKIEEAIVKGECRLRVNAQDGKDFSYDCPDAAARTSYRLPDGKPDYDALEKKLAAEHPEIPRPAVKKLFDYMKENDLPNTRYAAIANFDEPSDKKRLSLINLDTGDVDHYLVAHGKNSGGRYAEDFSNTSGSLQSALGLYETGQTYDGNNGRSLKLYGLEDTNSRSFDRSIVMHGADYVSDDAAASGQIGRSWGCPAVDFKYRDEIINRLQHGGMLLIYHS